MTITVLLGAGASYEAGLPMALGMTPKIMNRVDHQYRRLLQFVHSGLVMQLAAESAMGYHDDLAEVDVESLFNAVDALANRDGLNVAPFVSTWNPLVGQIEAHHESKPFAENNLARALACVTDGRSHSTDTAARDILKLLRDEFGAKSSRYKFKLLAQAMIDALEDLLKISDPSKVEYLLPLVSFHGQQDGGLSIASLNYDTVVEEAAGLAGVAVDDGLQQWNESGVQFRDDALRLFKLHGSVTWTQAEDGTIKYREDSDRRRRDSRPGLIFGSQNKLRADGPYLELLWEWRQQLSSCEHLIIIGYSFRDAHINAIIEAWVRRDPHKRITVVDPGFPRHGYGTQMGAIFARSNEALAPFDRRPGHAFVSYPDKATYAPVQIIRSGAGEALQDLFDKIKTWPPTKLYREDIV